MWFFSQDFPDKFANLRRKVDDENDVQMIDAEAKDLKDSNLAIKPAKIDEKSSQKVFRSKIYAKRYEKMNKK